MQKLLNKLMAVIIALILVSSTFMPVMVYATNTVGQNTSTAEKNVEFNATLNGEYDSSLDVNSKGTLDINIKVSETGYLKDSKISFGNNNYQVENVENSNIKAIRDNTIELDEVNAGEALNISLPILLPKMDVIDTSILGRDSTITLDAIYVNEKGKEKKISKTLNEHLEWVADSKEVVTQDLIRYIKMDQGKTMVSFKVKEGIEDNKLPVTNKNIKINVPTLGDVKPTNVIVTGEGIEYNYENDVITINKVNTPNQNGEIRWNSQDEYIVTYIYDTQVNEEVITSSITATSTVKNEEVVGKLENAKYELNEQTGSYIEAEISSAEEINKGYMYTNLKSDSNNLETEFDIKLNANIGYKDTTDIIKISEASEMFNDIDASSSIINKKIRINKENLINILGEEGTIKILSTDSKEIGVLSKDHLELEVNTENIELETSKIQNEGNLEIYITKAIKSDIQYSKQEISNFKEFTYIANVNGYKDNNEISKKQVKAVSKLIEPTSIASIDVNAENLSTIIKNEDVIITTTLETNDIQKALYSNAKLKITLPKEVKEINVKEADLLYEDELKLENLKVNGNIISLELNGTQTKYNTQATSTGTVIRIGADLTLDNLAPNSEQNIILDYYNEDTKEQKQIQKNINIIAPTGFVTTNSLELNGEKVTSQESDEKVAKIQANDSEKDVKVGATIVNNLGTSVNGVTILGTIPTSGNKNANEIDLGSNFDTKIASGLNVENVEADVYYSENVNENLNSSNWTSTYSSNAKAYKIVTRGTVEEGKVMNFGYNVKVPSNLEYGKTAKTDYAVYYNNNAEQGNNQNVVIAKAVGLTTGEVPVVELTQVLTDANTGKEIDKDVKEGEFLTYKLIVKNTGKEVANNVNISINLPNGIANTNLEYEMTDIPYYEIDTKNKTLNKNIGDIQPNEEKTIEYRLSVTKVISGMENEDTSLKITANVTADRLEENRTFERNLNVVKGSIVATVTSDKTYKSLKKGKVINYYIKIKNANYEEKNNINVTVNLPKELKVKEVVNNSGTEYKYNERANTLTYTKSKLGKGSSDGLLVSTEVSDFNDEKQININAKIKCDGMEEENLETLQFNLVKSTISASLSSNITSKNINDTDNLEYYINVKNNSSERIDIQINDNISENLRVTEYEIKDSNGSKTVKTSSRNILTSLQINSGETSRLTIKTSPYTLEKGRIANIENKASILVNDETIETNTLSHTIVGTSNTSAGVSTNPSGEVGNVKNENTQEGTYKITGTVWFDANGNGKKEESEQRMSGLAVKLYNKQTGKVALDVNGKELTITTNDSGEYSFVNVVPANYIVIVEYDNTNYAIAPYKMKDLSNSEDCDFIVSQVDGKEVASTDELGITNGNLYNIDLGLIRDKIFDLDISKTITRITVTNTKTDTKLYEYNNLEVAKVELGSKNIEFATVLVEYTLKITNQGTVAGYAKSIVDHIPEGMTFSSELNSSWYVGQDKDAYNTSLANTIINPGETKEIKIVLSRKMSSENTGTVRNSAEIVTAYNEYGISDIDAKSAQTKDKSSADAVIGAATGKEAASITGIALGILSIIAIAIYEIKKHVISKMYNII